MMDKSIKRVCVCVIRKAKKRERVLDMVNGVKRDKTRTIE